MLRVFGIPLSVHTRKVIVAATAKSIGYENEPVVPFAPPEGWKALSPTGLIPAIDHDGFRLADSTAICAYLERIQPEPSLYPEKASDLARALWLEQYGGGVLFHQLVRPLFHQKVIRPLILKQGEPDAPEIARVEEEIMPVVFGYLEEQIEGTFFVNGALSIADVTLVSNLLNYCYLGFSIDGTLYPKLAAVFARVIQQSPFQTSLQAEAPFAEQLGLDRSFLPH